MSDQQPTTLAGVPYEWVDCRHCDGHGQIGRVSGARMRALREQSGWSLRKLAYVIGVSSGYLGDMETGRRPMSEWWAERIIQTLQQHQTQNGGGW